MKKYLILIIIFFLTGCSSYIELNDLAIIDTISIQKEDNNYKLTISYIEKIEENNLNPQTKIIETKDTNINQLFNDLSLKINKKIYLSHLNLLLIDDSIKNKEFKELINYFLNNQDTREDFLIAYSNNINDLMHNNKFLEINDLVKINHQETSKVIYTTMYDVIKNYYEKKNIYLTNLTYQDNNILPIGIITFINNDYQELTEDQSIFINYLLDNIDTLNYTYKCQDNNYLNLKILKGKKQEVNNKLLITNEIIIISNDCHLNNQEINKIFNEYLEDNKIYTNKILNINNTIRGNYENK